MVTGKFDYESMVMAAPVLGPIVFFIFVLVATIVLVNIFLTLIISAFETVKHDVMKQDNEYEIVDFMKKKVKSLFGLYNFAQETNEIIDENERKLKMLEDQIAFLPVKIDHMLNYVNKVHFNGQLNLKSNHKINYESLSVDKIEGMEPKKFKSVNRNGRRNRRLSKQGSRNGDIQQNVPKIAFLNWNEVTD